MHPQPVGLDRVTTPVASMRNAGAVERTVVGTANGCPPGSLSKPWIGLGYRSRMVPHRFSYVNKPSPVEAHAT